MSKYPIYVISKGRWEQRPTNRALDKLGVSHHVVIEPQEFDNYAAVINPATILTLPEPNYGHGCSIPARNWVWEHAISLGVKRHWILDDNIARFERLNHNKKKPVTAEEMSELLNATENFVDRYSNVPLAGLRRRGDEPGAVTKKPYRLNTPLIYSAFLIQNNFPLRWRGVYNEDIDLCLRALKDGWVTMRFNTFLIDKGTTGRMKGGNTEIYAGDGLERKADSLVAQHPDVAKKVWLKKAAHWHHKVEYTKFENNRLVRALATGISRLSGSFGRYGVLHEPREEPRSQMGRRNQRRSVTSCLYSRHRGQKKKGSRA